MERGDLLQVVPLAMYGREFSFPMDRKYFFVLQIRGGGDQILTGLKFLENI
jgi:hypothetical protein